MGEITVFVEGADEASARPRPTNPVYDGTRPTPPYAIVCKTFPREPTWCPALPPATDAPRSWANPDLSPPLSRTRGAHHRGQVLWQECPSTPLLLLVVATRGDPGRVLGITPTHLYGAVPVPRPPLPAPAARDGVHTFLRNQEVTAVTGVHLVRPPPTPPDDPPGPRALGPAPDWELLRDAWAAWLPRLPSQCRWMTAGPRPCEADATAGPPPPPPRRAPHGTAHGTALMHQEVVGRALLPPRMPTRITVMADSDGSPQRDDRHHRRSRSRSPASPEWTGETLAEREERGLAEAAVLVGPPPPAREPEPAEVTTPAAQAASPAAPPREGAPDGQEAETAAPASHAAAPTAAPGTPPTRGVAPAQEPGASPRAAAAAEESEEGARGVATAAPAGRATASAGHAATPSTPRKRGTDAARATGASPAAAAAAAVSRESARYRAHANPTHIHTSPPKQFPRKPFPPGRARHVRPPAPERSLPVVTLPQLQRQRDARRVVQEGGEGAQAELRASHGSAERGQEATGKVPRSARKEQARARAAGSKGAAARGGRAQAADGATQGRGPGRDQGTGRARRGAGRVPRCRERGEGRWASGQARA